MLNSDPVTPPAGAIAMPKTMMMAMLKFNADPVLMSANAGAMESSMRTAPSR